MEKVLSWAIGALVLIGGLLLGKWFSTEASRIKAEGKPLYKAYFTTPGIFVLITFSAVIIYYLVSH